MNRAAIRNVVQAPMPKATKWPPPSIPRRSIRRSTLRHGRGLALRPGGQGLELGVAGIHVIEEAIELARGLTQIVAELVWIEHARQPFEPDHAVERRRAVDPAKRRGGREIDAILANGANAGPERIPLHPVEEVAIPGENDLGIGHDHLLHGGTHKTALPGGLRDVAAACTLDDLGID